MAGHQTKPRDPVGGLGAIGCQRLRALRVDKPTGHGNRIPARMNELPLSKAFRLIEPGPVVLVTTAHHGKANIMTMSWHMVMDFTPRVGCIIGSWDYSFGALCATKECVIAIPTVDLAERVVDIGNCSGRDVDKFRTFRLTPLAAGS